MNFSFWYVPPFPWRYDHGIVVNGWCSSCRIYFIFLIHWSSENKFEIRNTKKSHIDVFTSRIIRSGSCVDLFSSHDWSCDHNTRLCYQADQPTVWRLFSKFYYSIASGDMSEGFIGKIMKMTDVLVPNKFTVSVRNFFRSCKRPALKNNGVSFSKMADETKILQ